MKDDKNSDNCINQSNSVIGIKLCTAQSDPIKRRPLYIQKIFGEIEFHLFEIFDQFIPVNLQFVKK